MYKKGYKTDSSSYGGISLLSRTYKIETEAYFPSYNINIMIIRATSTVPASEEYPN